MGQVFLRILLVVIVVQESYRLPVFLILSEMICHGPHGRGDVGCVEDQVFLRHHRSVDLFRLLQCKFFHNHSSCIFIRSDKDSRRYTV